MKGQILQGDCLDVLKTLPDESVDCCITSPPYYGLRDYGTGKWIGGDPNCPHRRLSKFSEKTITGHHQIELVGNVGDVIYKTVCPLCGAVREDKQIGLEETPEEYVNRLVAVFREVKRVLKEDGTLWLNIGDSYAAQRGGTHPPAETLAGGVHGYTEDGESVNRGRESGYNPTRNASAIGLKHKDMIGIPWMLAFALRADGWYLRQDIIWAKPNPMPESVKDRCTKSHEYLFLLSKSQKYYFDSEAIAEECADSTWKRLMEPNLENQEGGTTPSKKNGKMKAVFPKFGGNKYGDSEDPKYAIYSGNEWVPTGKRNKRDVWMIPVQPTKEAHFATYPEALVEPCILAGSRPGGGSAGSVLWKRYYRACSNETRKRLHRD